MDTLYLIIALFALGAIVGLYLLSFVLQQKETSKFAAFIHGAFVATALVLLILYYSNHPGLTESLVLFVLAALGGLVLIIRDLSGKKLPKWLAMGHGLIAIAGFVFLLVYAFTGR